MLTFAPLTSEQKTQIVGNAATSECLAALKSDHLGFETPYELTLFAECMTEVGQKPTRGALFDAYVRRRCAVTDKPAVVRRILSAVGDMMWRGRLVSSLSMVEVWRVGQRILAAESERSELLSVALSCGLLDARQGKCSFRHEMIERWFQAEALAQHNSPDTLARELALPRNRGLAEFLLSAESDETIVRRCLETLADSAVINDCLLGRYGDVPKGVAERDCGQLLSTASDSLEWTRFEFVGNDGLGGVVVSGAASWTEYQTALMNSIGERWRRDCSSTSASAWLVTQRRPVAGQSRTDQVLEGKLSLKELASVFASLFVFTGPDGKGPVPASTIFHAFRFSRWDAGRRSPRTGSTELLRDPWTRLPSELMFLCVLAKHPRVRHENLGDLLEAGWATGLYHLRLEMLELARSVSERVSGPGRDRIVSFLSSLDPKNLFLSTSLVDALLAYGEIPAPGYIRRSE